MARVSFVELSRVVGCLLVRHVLPDWLESGVGRGESVWSVVGLGLGWFGLSGLVVRLGVFVPSFTVSQSSQPSRGAGRLRGLCLHLRPSQLAAANGRIPRRVVRAKLRSDRVEVVI